MLALDFDACFRGMYCCEGESRLCDDKVSGTRTNAGRI